MPIIPSGKRKIMEAQSTLQNGPQQWGLGGDFGGAPVEEHKQEPMMGNMPGEGMAGPTGEPQQPQGQQEGQPKTEGSKKPDLLEYIYSVLEELGYPPRRLEVFSDEFIEENMYPGGVKEVKVTLPDRYYGQKKRITDKDLSKIMNQIQESFGLTLTQATRKEKKVIMDFTSQPATNPEDEEVPGDDLDEIFGAPKGQEKPKMSKTPTTTKARPQKKAAEAIGQMIKESKSDLIEKLYEIVSRKESQ